MLKKVDILGYLLPMLREYKEYKVIAQAINPELDLLWEAIEKAQNNQFIYSSDEYGVSRKEKITGITPKDTDTLEDRKFRLIVKEMDSLPFTRRFLHKKLTLLCGYNGYYLNIDYNAFTIEVGLTNFSTSNIDIIKNLLDEIIPENMIIKVFHDVSYEVDSTLYSNLIANSNKYYALSCDFNEKYDIDNELIQHNIAQTNKYIEIQ